MERETITIETPVDKHKVVLKAWITGGEKRALRRPFLASMKISVTGEDKKEPKVEDINPADMQEKAENEAIKTIIVSINGKAEDVLVAVLDMREKDYDFVIAEMNKITKEVSFQKPE